MFVSFFVQLCLFKSYILYIYTLFFVIWICLYDIYRAVVVVPASASLLLLLPWIFVSPPFVSLSPPSLAISCLYAYAYSLLNVSIY